MRPDARVGTDFGPYRIDDVIGRGGMGVVYLAEQPGLGRRVALKLLTPDYADDEAFRARFLRESKMAAAIDHPNIIPIYDAGEIEGTYYLAMRYVEGVDLDSRLRAGRLEPREVVGLLAQVAAALDAAHTAGLVHRDVKPANVLIDSGKGVDLVDHAYLTDFGLTKQRGSQSGLTQAGGFMGTLEYIAPEQIEGQPVDGRADQYALAAIAVSALTGQVPFPRDSDVAIINAHLHDPPPSVHVRVPELPIGVDAVIARAMAKAPADRYPDCRAFVEALRDALGVSDTHRRPLPTSSGARDRRLPLLIGGLVALGIVGVVGFVLASGGSATPTAASPPASLAAGSPSVGVEPSLSEDVFPNAAEAALLAALNGKLGDECVRGRYDPVMGESSFERPRETPIASLDCKPGIVSGASEVVVRWFVSVANNRAPFTTEDAVSAVATLQRAPAGDCATSKRASGRWQLAGDDAGTIVCYVDSTTGDAILYWSYKDHQLLVKATNQKGDSAALYAFFQNVARFITP
jgi:serine/threonine-protein kinase